MYTKGEVTDYVWQYSKYYGDLLGSCNIILDEINGHSALINLFNITEIIFKSKLNDYEINFYTAIEKLEKQGVLTKTERNFLNNKNTGVRKFRNIFAHANLIKYNLIFDDEPGVLYPFTENETCVRLYNMISPILYNLILKIVFNHLFVNNNITLDNEIKKIKLVIKEITPEELLSYQGIDYRENLEWDNLDQITKYRLAENCSQVDILVGIFKNLLIK